MGKATCKRTRTHPDASRCKTSDPSSPRPIDPAILYLEMQRRKTGNPRRNFPYLSRRDSPGAKKDLSIQASRPANEPPPIIIFFFERIACLDSHSFRGGNQGKRYNNAVNGDSRTASSSGGRISFFQKGVLLISSSHAAISTNLRF